MGGLMTFLQNLTAGVGTASNTPQGTAAANNIYAPQQKRGDEQSQKLSMLQDAAKKQQLRVAAFTDPNTGKPYEKYKDQYQDALNGFGSAAEQIWETQHPRPANMPLVIRMGIRALNKMHLMGDIKSRIDKWGDRRLEKWRNQEKQFAGNLAAADAPTPDLGSLTPEEQHKSNLVKGEIEPKAEVPKDAPENWQQTDLHFKDGTTRTVEMNSKSGEYRTLGRHLLSPEELDGATSVPNPAPVHAPTPKAGVSGGKNVFAILTDNGWVDAGSKETLKDFRPAPTFAETGLWGVDPVQHADGSIGSAMVNRRTGQVKKITSLDGSPIAPALLAQVNKSLEPALESDTRFRVMKDAEKDALNGNQQAMLNIVANHMGMTLGQQKGTKVSQAQWNEAIASAPWIETQAAKWFHTDENGDHVFDGFKGGVNITPTQIHQMVDLAVTRRKRQWQQAQQSGQMYGVNVPVPDDLDKPSSTLEGPKTKELKSAQGKGGRIKVKLQDGRKGTIDAVDFDSKTMTKVQ